MLASDARRASSAASCSKSPRFSSSRCSIAWSTTRGGSGSGARWCSSGGSAARRRAPELHALVGATGNNLGMLACSPISRSAWARRSRRAFWLAPAPSRTTATRRRISRAALAGRPRRSRHRLGASSARRHGGVGSLAGAAGARREVRASRQQHACARRGAEGLAVASEEAPEARAALLVKRRGPPRRAAAALRRRRQPNGLCGSRRC